MGRRIFSPLADDEVRPRECTSPRTGESLPLRTAPDPSLGALIRSEMLVTLFQPLVSLSAGSIFGYEAQVRGPAGSSLESPGALFRRAAAENLVEELEFAALCAARRCWLAQAPQACGS